MQIVLFPTTHINARWLPVWDVAAEDEVRRRASAAEEQRKAAAEIQKRREDIKRHSISGH